MHGAVQAGGGPEVHPRGRVRGGEVRFLHHVLLPPVRVVGVVVLPLRHHHEARRLHGDLHGHAEGGGPPRRRPPRRRPEGRQEQGGQRVAPGDAWGRGEGGG